MIRVPAIVASDEQRGDEQRGDGIGKNDPQTLRSFQARSRMPESRSPLMYTCFLANYGQLSAGVLKHAHMPQAQVRPAFYALTPKQPKRQVKSTQQHESTLRT